MLSLGVDHYWRKIAVKMSEVSDGDHLLDMCCGTGDLAIAFAKLSPELNCVTGADFSAEMLAIAAAKQEKLKAFGNSFFRFFKFHLHKSSILIAK